MTTHLHALPREISRPGFEPCHGRPRPTLRDSLLHPSLPNGRASHAVWVRTAETMGLSERRLVERVVGWATPYELDRYAADFVRFARAHGEPTPTARQAEDFAWRLAAGYRLGEPTFFLHPLRLPRFCAEDAPLKTIGRRYELNASRWDGALCCEATDELLATLRAATADSGGCDRSLFAPAYEEDDDGLPLTVY